MQNPNKMRTDRNNLITCNYLQQICGFIKNNFYISRSLTNNVIDNTRV